MSKEYEVVIGLEVHVELATKTKIFCGCSTAFGGAPNTHTCPVCTGMPGALPVLNRQVVEYALAVGLAANCSINQYCKFDRKNYFYPDNPQNYQISQLYLPLCRNGYVEIEEDREGNPVTPHLNWAKAIPWRNANEDEQRAIESLYRTNPITGVKELDPEQLNYRYETYNHTEAARRRNRLNPERREYNTDKPVPVELPVISKDTAFINDDGEIVRQTVTRALTGPYDFVNTYIVNVYPDTTAWINDFDNAYNEPYVRMYFSHAGYNDYPVVGVSWEQASAYANWRTDFLRRSLGREGVYVEPYRLPTEAEWEYAARAGKSGNMYPWDGDLPLTEEQGCFYANFKPQEGNFVQDGQLITSKVGTYSPNAFGLYDMAGNVSEWTSTAYSESIDRITSDLNPEYRYDAALEDPYRMKRKIVRGGSWKDVAHNVRSDIRMWEYQNEQRSYIGFRCVRSRIGFAKGTRK